MKFQLIELGYRVIKMASRPVFIDYHSILATFSNVLYNMIFKKYWFKDNGTNIDLKFQCVNLCLWMN